jgi:hypothetical protein
VTLATDLLARLDRLNALHERIGSIALSVDADRRQELVDARRELAHCIGEISQAADALLPTICDAAAITEYRQHLGAMRSSAALHQASWPAISMTADRAGYAASSGQVRDAHRAFDGWMRRTISGATGRSLMGESK